MHTQSTTAHRNNTEISDRRFASFNVRTFAGISPECSHHPTNPRATTNLCGPKPGDKAYLEQGTAGVVRKFGERVTAQVSSASSDRGSKLRGSS
ncbi:hypothetical protein AVEN_57363-1 [Araneus ventricosus]|uniref:Uncharacterized protein n=1 Tax=Araneus ventricosus TaxID=182803 RepID=A0A4Y2U4S1_ARAVE|nr:hypothetical protein AVEN_57363-1 [Araneus ventricosus]